MSTVWNGYRYKSLNLIHGTCLHREIVIAPSWRHCSRRALGPVLSPQNQIQTSLQLPAKDQNLQQRHWRSVLVSATGRPSVKCQKRCNLARWIVRPRSPWRRWHRHRNVLILNQRPTHRTKRHPRCDQVQIARTRSCHPRVRLLQTQAVSFLILQMMKQRLYHDVHMKLQRRACAGAQRHVGTRDEANNKSHLDLVSMWRHQGQWKHQKKGTDHIRKTHT